VRKLFLLLLLTAGVVTGGEILQPVCHDCGYSGAEIWAGNGPDCEYGSLMYVYFCPADRIYYSAVFDPTTWFASKAGLLVPAEWTGRQEFQEEHSRALGRFLDSWAPPGRIDPSGFLTTDLVSFGDGVTPGGAVFLVDDPWSGLHTCPRCGVDSLEFVVSGLWD
jgi:hypothetical protein